MLVQHSYPYSEAKRLPHKLSQQQSAQEELPVLPQPVVFHMCGYQGPGGPLEQSTECVCGRAAPSHQCCGGDASAASSNSICRLVLKVKRLPPAVSLAASRFTLLKTPLPAAAVSLACLASPSGPTPIVRRRFRAVEPHYDCVWHREPSGTSPSSIYSKVREDARISQRLRCTCHTPVAD